MSKHRVFWVYLLGLWYIPVSGVKITSLDVPKSAWDPVQLNCKYDLEGGNLFAVKWYKDNSEFFRCTADGDVQEFHLKNISVFHTGRSQFGSCFFELTPLNSHAGGVYKCEVSLEWPTFLTASRFARLDVIEPSRFVQPEVTTVEDIVTIDLTESKGSAYLSSAINILIVAFVIYTF